MRFSTNRNSRFLCSVIREGKGGGRRGGGGGGEDGIIHHAKFELLDELRGDWPVVEIRQACTI